MKKASSQDAYQPAYALEMEDRLGVRLYGDKAGRWLRLLNEPLDMGGMNADTRDEELVEVVRFVARQKQQVPEHFTVDKLWSWLRWYRKEKSAWRKGYAVDTQEGFMAMVKAKMREAATPLDAWNIMCNPDHYVKAPRTTTLRECEDLEAWAGREGLWDAGWRPEFARPEAIQEMLQPTEALPF